MRAPVRPGAGKIIKKPQSRLIGEVWAMRIALAQTDCALGEVAENIDHAREQIKQAADQGADLVVFPELSLHGYHLGALKRDCSIEASDPRLLELSLLGPDVLVGFHEHTSLRAYNTAA